MKKEILFLFFVFVHIVTLADDSGQCGPSVYYKYVTSSHTLSIYGEGQMYDYHEIIHNPDNSTQINFYPKPWDAYKGEIKDLYIESGVTSLGGAAFTEFYSLNTITIPPTINNIDYCAFDGSSSKEIHITDLLSWMKINFASGQSNPAGISESFYINGEEIKDIVIPSEVSVVKDYCFFSCKWLNTISFPNTLKKIDNFAFRFCDNLTSLTIPDGVESIGEYAFGECSAIQSVEFPNSVNSIGVLAFGMCSNLKSVVLPNSLVKINNEVFHWCSSLESVVIGSSVKEICSYAFSNCKSLQNVYCHSEMVPKTDEWAFWNVEEVYNANLHVPVSSVDSYKNTIPWNRFKAVIALNDDDPKAFINDIILDKNKLSIYSLSGRKLNNAAKGINIVNGKKVILNRAK